MIATWEFKIFKTSLRESTARPTNMECPVQELLLTFRAGSTPQIGEKVIITTYWKGEKE